MRDIGKKLESLRAFMDYGSSFVNKIGISLDISAIDSAWHCLSDNHYEKFNETIDTIIGNYVVEKKT